jgi:2-methylisocitrate lyase-like PEP mutase family enzyme
MSDPTTRFLELHTKGSPLLLPNPWDVGTARLFATLGFQALATTSSGSAAAQGRLDGALSREEVLNHSAEIARACELPVTADLENGFGDRPEPVAETVRLASELGLAGCSIEDYGGAEPKIYDAGLAAERVAAAAEAAHTDAAPLVLTARAENHLRGRPLLDDTIARLQSFQEAGADVVYAPGLRDLQEIRQGVASVDVPVNVLIWPDGPTPAELAAAGVARLSVGGNFNLVALGAVTEAAREFLAGGPLDFWETARVGRELRGQAFRG